jgi:hypothetical protein
MVKQDNLSLTLEIAKEITEIAKTFEIKGEAHQFTTQIHPIVSNMLYRRTNDVLETERLKTLCKLARVFTNEEMERVYDALKYTIS